MIYILKIIPLFLLDAGSVTTAIAQEKITDEELLQLYDGFRVADVSDGMDMVGLRDVGIVDQEILCLKKNSISGREPGAPTYQPKHLHILSEIDFGLLDMEGDDDTQNRSVLITRCFGTSLGYGS